MKTLLPIAAFACALLVGSCAGSRETDSAREWQRAECNRVIDPKDRERCLKRVDEDFGRRSREERAAPQK